MPNSKPYIILSTRSREDMEDAVQEKIQEGYQPYGDLIIKYTKHEQKIQLWFDQVMVMPEETVFSIENLKATAHQHTN